jgi:hypothetical protein
VAVPLGAAVGVPVGDVVEVGAGASVGLADGSPGVGDAAPAVVVGAGLEAPSGGVAVGDGSDGVAADGSATVTVTVAIGWGAEAVTPAVSVREFLLPAGTAASTCSPGVAVAGTMTVVEKVD